MPWHLCAGVSAQTRARAQDEAAELERVLRRRSVAAWRRMAEEKEESGEGREGEDGAGDAPRAPRKQKRCQHPDGVCICTEALGCGVVVVVVCRRRLGRCGKRVGCHRRRLIYRV